jgi:hypothetical protein
VHDLILPDKSFETVRTWVIWASFSVLSLLVNFAVQWRGEHSVNFTSEAARVSWALQHHRGFSDPYLSGLSGPTAQMAPFYPSLHAAICMVFGIGAGGWTAIVALTTIVWALHWTFAYRFLKNQGHPWAGLAAGLLGVLVPLPGRLFKWEAVFTACALAGGACLFVQFLNRPDRTKALLWGVATAISVLLAPATVVVFFVWGLIFFRRVPRKRAIHLLAIAAACAALPVGVWTARNYLIFGHLFFIRDDVGFAIGSSDADCSRAVLADNIASGCFAAVHPTASVALLEDLKQQGEYGFAQQYMENTKRWVRANPRKFLTLTAERFAYFWFPIERNDRRSLLNGLLMSTASLLSLLAMLWRRSTGFTILAAALVLYPLPYYLVQAEQRYRYPVYWMSVLLAAVGMELAVQRWRQTKTATR